MDNLDSGRKVYKDRRHEFDNMTVEALNLKMKETKEALKATAEKLKVTPEDESLKAQKKELKNFETRIYIRLGKLGASKGAQKLKEKEQEVNPIPPPKI